MAAVSVKRSIAEVKNFKDSSPYLIAVSETWLDDSIANSEICIQVILFNAAIVVKTAVVEPLRCLSWMASKYSTVGEVMSRMSMRLSGFKYSS